MKNLSSWLISFFIIGFWIFRVVVAIMAQLNLSFMVTPIDLTTEIILLFAVIICIPFIYKRKMIGGIIYLGLYGWYFGQDILNSIINITNGETITAAEGFSLFISLIGIILAVVNIFDILLDKGRKANPIDKKTDWFYKNKEFDRKLDDRADKNNYRTM